ncbi:MAG: hypothetical protein H6R39_310 [Deltaproteobacteria bacterium]|nr:hypothetical protein [Deltaproteobacteria bacterium]
MLTVIRCVIKEFGFVENKRLRTVPDVVSFGKGEKVGTKYNMLDGSDATISLVFATGPSPSILIQDLSYVEETEFMKTFKSQLETRLNEVVDMKNVWFIREFDFLN